MGAPGRLLAYWGILFPEPYGLCVAALAAAPLLGVLLAPWFEGRTGLNVAEGRPSGTAGLIFPAAVVLALRGLLDLHVLDLLPALLVGGVLAGVFATLVVWATGEEVETWRVATFSVLAFGYGYGLAVEANALTTGARPVYVRTQVTDTWTSGSSRNPTYRLTLAGPLYPGVPDSVEVDGDFLRANPVGSEVCVKIYRGRFGWRFWEVGYCPG